MVSGQLDAPAPRQRGSLDHVDSWPVVSLHIAITGGEVLRFPPVQVARDGQRLEKHLGHDDGAAEVQNHAAVIEIGEAAGEPFEVAVTRGAGTPRSAHATSTETARPGRSLRARRYAASASPAP